MVYQKVVTLFLMDDGLSSGRIKCSMKNWTGVVYLIPRTELSRSADIGALSQTGIYLLFGTDTKSGEEKLYVGQAGERKRDKHKRVKIKGVLNRVREHLTEEKHDYFTHAIMIVGSDNSLGSTEISYLENAFYNQAKTADRMVVTNANDPSAGNVTEEQKAWLDEFISNALILIRALGYRAFDAPDSERSEAEPLLYLNFKDNSAHATGRQTNDGFVVLAGSKIRATTTTSVPPSAIKNRKRFADRLDADGVLKRDIPFDSPSAAAEFLTGASVSGKRYWKNSEGIPLKELERRDLESIP